MGKNNNRSKEFREELVLGVEYINFLTVWSQAKHGNCLRGELLRAGLARPARQQVRLFSRILTTSQLTRPWLALQLRQSPLGHAGKERPQGNSVGMRHNPAASEDPARHRTDPAAARQLRITTFPSGRSPASPEPLFHFTHPNQPLGFIYWGRSFGSGAARSSGTRGPSSPPSSPNPPWPGPRCGDKPPNTTSSGFNPPASLGTRRGRAALPASRDSSVTELTTARTQKRG